MSNIQIYKDTAIELAKQQTKEVTLHPYLNALKSKRVLESSDAEIVETISKAVSQATFDMGHKPKEEIEYKLMIASILDEIKISFIAFTLGELNLACKRGSQGAYGENMGINVVGVIKWLNGYKNDLNAQKAKKEIIDASHVKEAPKELTDEDRKELSLSAFERFKNTGVYEDYGNIVYLFLERIGNINFTDERKLEMKTEVMKNELTTLSAPLSLEEKRKFDRQKQEILDGSMDLKAKCRRYALHVYFKELVEMGLELNFEN